MTGVAERRQRSIVTGGLGFVGRHLVDALAGRGDAVVSIDVGSGPSEGVSTGVGGG